MAYKVINSFRDSEDNTYYRVGDEFPKGDSIPSKERIEELSTVHPEYKRIFIEAVDSEKENTVDDTNEEPESKAETEEEEKNRIKAELESLSVSFHPNTGLEKLREKLEEAKTGKEDKE